VEPGARDLEQRLQGRVVLGLFGETESIRRHAVALDALVGLGYSSQQAKDVLKLVKATEPSEKIREALKYLSKA
jgi:Holliday junction resolvasome RuvABC DNA-binding subunit